MTTQSETTASALPLSRAEKEKLLDQMYRLSHWIDLIRLIGYKTWPMALAREAIKPLAEKYGKEKVASACETLVEISTQGQEAFARLKPHVRRMAFQMLGPEPEATCSPCAAASAPCDPKPAADDVQSRPAKKERSKSKSPTKLPSEPACSPEANYSSSGYALMDQYRAAKERHPNMLLLFRMGDFYELFAEDAEIAHRLLGLTLTTRDRTLAMAGFPHHQLEAYLHKLLKDGQRVAICEPVEESLARGPIRREVTRVVTPGAANDDQAETSSMDRNPTPDKGRPVNQPRHFVLKEFEKWMKAEGLAYDCVNEVRRTTPAVVPYVGVLDFVVLRGDDKLLVTVRPRLQSKHVKAMHELHSLYGSEYKPVRVWPSEGPSGWQWPEEPVDMSKIKPA